MAHRILKSHPDTAERGIYIEGELTTGTMWLSETLFPALIGITNEEKMRNLESALHTLFDSTINPQRVRVRILSLSPLEYQLGIFANNGEITTNWYV